jgi:hypothetical protein
MEEVSFICKININLVLIKFQFFLQHSNLNRFLKIIYYLKYI